MYRLLLLILLTGLLAYCFSRDNQHLSRSALLAAYKIADKTFNQAENLAAQETDDEVILAKVDQLYQLSLIQFSQLIPKVEEAGFDSLALFLHIKAGFINNNFDSTAAAKKNYLTAISLKEKLAAIPDSLLFEPLLYIGGIYYTQNQFDSALSFYKKAELINDSHKKPLNEAQRLYNRLGVMYYETGNYRQARNYFEKAISSLRTNNPALKSLLVNYKINIASISIKLEDFTQAEQVYESILPLNVYSNEINHNLGIIKLKKEDYSAALGFFKKVNYENNKKIIDLYYNYGMIYSNQGETDSADLYFHKALTENLKWNGHRPNTSYGLILKYQADDLARQEKLDESLLLYQQALTQFDNSFTEKDVKKNPEQFSGVFSYINLFNTLTAKANVLEQLYQKEKETKLLEASLETYQSAFRLANYVEKTYNSDESRLFLGKIKHTVHSRPIETGLLLYQLTRQRKYLEDVYHFDQQNKATILSLNVQENEIRNNAGPLQELLNKEAAFKSIITRHSLKAAGLNDSTQLSGLNATIRDNEIELGKIQEQLNTNPSWQQRRASDQIPPVSELQKKLDNTTALLSFHLSENELLTLFVSSTQFEFRKVPVNKKFFSSIETFRSALQNTSGNNRYNGMAAGTNLYKTIIGPIQYRLAKINRLIIIPDDELNYIPLEALQDDAGKYLIEKFSIQYQYSTALLGKDATNSLQSGTLAFAPFASRAAADLTGNLFSGLPASKEETDKLKGKIFIDSAATKNNFLQHINQYAIVHLATHASVNNEDPLRSFIVFSPVKDDYKLYGQEIFDLNLDSTDLIILSACETGAGQLVKGEGLMSLSRAFAYAGCSNIITSLWKAEDKTTAFITQRLHYYLDQKYSKDKALQLAKLDLLRSAETDPRFKTPNYWAHLLYIGNYEANHEKNNWWWVAIGIIGVLTGFYIAKKIKKPAA